MNKKEIREQLEEFKDDREILVRIINKTNPAADVSFVPIDYIIGSWVNIAFEEDSEILKNMALLTDEEQAIFDRAKEAETPKTEKKEKDMETAGDTLQKIYDSGITVRLGWMWDGGLDYSIGSDSNDLWDSNYNKKEIRFTGEKIGRAHV